MIITSEGSRYSLLLGENQGKGIREDPLHVKNAKHVVPPYKCDKHYGDWLHIWNELTQTAGHQIGYANMVGNTPYLTTPSATTGVTVAGDTLYIPLEFFFNRNPGLALPLIALN